MNGMLEMLCELKFCIRYRYNPYLKQWNPYSKVGMKGISKFFAKVDHFLLEYNSRKNYSNLSFYLKRTCLCIMNTLKLPFGIYQEMHLELSLLFCHCKFRFWNWGLAMWHIAHERPELLFLQDFVTEEHIFNLPFMPWFSFLFLSWITIFLVVLF